MMKKNGKTKPRRQRIPMFENARTVSFKMDDEKISAATKAAFAREIPFSMWMREAADEKMERETAVK